MYSLKHLLNFVFSFILILLSSQSFSETITFKGLVLTDFWINKVIANNNVTRTVTWQRAEGASWSPDSPTNDLMRRAIFYTYKESLSLKTIFT